MGRLPIAERLARHTDRSAGSEGCWIWFGSKNSSGYGKLGGVVLGSTAMAHRVAWWLEHGPIPEGMCVCHRCDVVACVNPAHLFLGTRRENMQDMVAKGRNRARTKPELVQRGSENGASKLTEQAVREIRALASEGASRSKLAAQFGVNYNTVRDVLRGVTWRQVA